MPPDEDGPPPDDLEPPVGVTDAETVAHLRQWQPGLPFGWPTDACGYTQHIRFVTWRNRRLDCGLVVDILEYANELEAGRIPPLAEGDL